mmetsp:Transcript_47584/g.101587  ORF Transcript_47584/g.101587 Transcript_47584/m.101587 type:complete len:224 (+) Transcript_47584:884-1555(+)
MLGKARPCNVLKPQALVLVVIRLALIALFARRAALILNIHRSKSCQYYQQRHAHRECFCLLIGRTQRILAVALRAGAAPHRRGPLGAPAVAAFVRGLGKARVAQKGVEVRIEQDVCWLEVAVPRAALALHRCVEVEQRLNGLAHDPQLLPPRQLLWRRRCKLAHPAQVLDVERLQVQPRLQAAAHHQRKDEARRRWLKAEANQLQEVRVRAHAQDGHFLLEIR